LITKRRRKGGEKKLRNEKNLLHQYSSRSNEKQIRNEGKKLLAKQNKSFKEFPKMEPKRITYRKKKIFSKATAAKHNVLVQLFPIRK
jgi:hypothetical protein